jgi:CheY-like chemotaxis protein
MHGGAVEARSKGAGRGATFVIRLPRRRIVAPLAETAAEREAEPGSLAGLRVLVVDDDAETLQILTLALSAFGAEARPAASAAAALEEISRASPDVLISDIGMPGVDGFELMERVRALDAFAELPAIALTAYAGAEDGARAIQAGFDERAVKPADLPELVSTILRLTGRGSVR